MANPSIVIEKLCSVFSAYTYLALTCSFLTALGSINGVANGNKIVLHLIHRDSIFLPSLFYHTNHAKNIFNSGSDDDDVRGPLLPDKKGGLFLVNVSIGEPPIPQLLAMDTGSSLTWVQHQDPLHPIYDPKTSSTYTTLSCESTHECINYFGLTDCEKSQSQCIYNISYIDGSSSKGIVALEKFTFMSSNTGDIAELPDLLFGWGLESRGTAAELGGILGLQIINVYSIVSRVGKKFSYCIGNISDPNYMYNQLVLGEGAVIEGYSTPMLFNWQGHYVVSLEGISVGEKQLEINKPEFEYNVVVDSGSTDILLLRSAYEMVKKEVMDLVDGLIRRVVGPKIGERLCYWGNLVRDLKGFPTVTLHLARGVDISLDGQGMFRRINDDIFCMAVDVAIHGTNIIGIVAQQNYNIGFDLNEMKVSFLSIECELLED